MEALDPLNVICVVDCVLVAIAHAVGPRTVQAIRQAGHRRVALLDHAEEFQNRLVMD